MRIRLTELYLAVESTNDVQTTINLNSEMRCESEDVRRDVPTITGDSESLLATVAIL